METANPSRQPRSEAFVAGLHTGIIAVLVMLPFLALASAWYRHSIWTAANLMATSFYGDAAMGRGFSWRTLSGLAVYLILYGLVGAAFGVAIQGRGTRAHVTAIGVMVGLGWYLLLFGLVWKALNPLIPLYTHDRPMVVAHLLYGLLLGRFPVHLAAMRPKPQPPSAPESETAPFGRGSV